MGRFSYLARTKEGKKESGVVEIVSEDALISGLQERGLLVIKVASLEKKPAETADGQPRRRLRKFTHRQVKGYDLVFLARQLATMLEAGITIHKSLETLLKQVDSYYLHDVINQAKKNVEEGLTLKDALARHPKVFSDLWVNLVESGEASGNLGLVLNRLANYLEVQAGFRRKVVSALIYPAILFLVAISAILIFVTRIVPTFTTLFESFGAKLPFATRMLIKFSDIVSKGFVPGVIVIVLTFFLYRQALRNPAGKRAIDNFKMQLPLVGNFFKILGIERFTAEMAILIEGGVPILYALEITERGLDNKVLESIVRSIKTNVRAGKSLADLLAKTDFFEPIVVQMISVGEEVGELAKMFKRVADFYEEYVETFIGRFTTIFEPAMLLFMGALIGVMLVALFMPIFSMANLASMSGTGF